MSLDFSLLTHHHNVFYFVDILRCLSEVVDEELDLSLRS